MKKLLILSIAIINLLSCSSKNDTLDPIIGTWSEAIEENIKPKALDDCSKMDTVTFNEDFTYTSTRYDSNGGNCIPEENPTTGVWNNNNNNSYTFTFGENNENIVPATFTNNNNTMTLSEGEDKEVYIRVN